MHKTVLILSRFVFAGTALSLFLILFLGIVVGINHSKRQELISQKNNGEGVVLAAQNEMYGDENQEMMSDKVVGGDARPLLIKKYLEKYQSPLANYSDLIIKLSDTYGFDYYWIVAIAQQESNLCKKIPEDSHNCWGYGINSAGTLRFQDYETSLKSYAEYLKREYFDKGLNTSELIMKKYCPHSDGSWAYGVNQFIHEIETGNF